MAIDVNKRRLFGSNKVNIVNDMLPWVADASQFIEQCTQCGDCLSACPENIIVKGDGGFPCLDFDIGECNFCGKCAEICKEPIFKDTAESPWHKKAVINDTCLAYQKIYCRSCAESCEAQALTFQVGISEIPRIDIDLCTGCGACVAPCPSKSISVKE
ncbi:ferredoxin-type protein NapF [Psychromonas sp. KJ10-10]|uniref:ferredoxin-type protein NapF n=1 Tax=Psychromonas sp. KJ10-10 TaxID=3391823 RepID=UPI0039B6A587